MKILRYILLCSAWGLPAVCAALVSGCGDGINHLPPPTNSSTDAIVYSELEQQFLDDAVALQQRPELDVERVTVQYILIANGIVNIGGDKPDIGLRDALTKAADLYQQARAGDDFDKLVLTYSYGRIERGQRPGTFTLYRDDLPPNLGPTTFLRTMEEPSVWKAAWRLKPGEIGPVERHEKQSNSGYYIVRRLTEAEWSKDNPLNHAAATPEIQRMRDDAKALLQRGEHVAKRVKVQHLLIMRYTSDNDGKKKRLMPDEAEALAAEAYTKAKAGGNFNDLIREYSYDQIEGDEPGKYLMVADKSEASPFQSAREGMIPWFGDAAWRLEVGEVGVILYDSANSWYGYHIIKRIE